MNLMAYVVLALCVLLAVAGIVADVEYRKTQTLTTQLAGAKNQITADGTALTQEKVTATAFESAAKEWQAKCGTVPEAEQATAQLVTLEAQLTAARRQLAQQETQDEKLPQCANLMALDVGAACPSLGNWLRQLPGAQGNLRGSAGAGAGAGSSAPAR